MSGNKIRRAVHVSVLLHMKQFTNWLLLYHVPNLLKRTR